MRQQHWLWLLYFVFVAIYANLRADGDGVSPQEAKQLRDEIDSLDTLALLGDRDTFSSAVQWVSTNVQFNILIDLVDFSSHCLKIVSCKFHLFCRGWCSLICSLIGIIPLAERLGYATEQMAAYTGPTVLGCSFFAGGIVHYDKKEQIFNKGTAVVNSGLLLMAVMGLSFPAVLHFTHSEVRYGKSEVALSRFSSCIMLIAYASYLVFHLYSRIDNGASESFNLPVAFISVILLPIVGNAAEHASAVMFAMKDKVRTSL
ncbi:vacuolar cation/proton exchanger 2-like isoform X2 [Carex littledalei]|uniref:Vacuolar cation/proton exchanger 2-like isoform X2 n=1 Tax=Carex littledalei TaxID=544730 RepID=A0A833VGF9_9POAL|nr:vacuolar cation/proton exchanger 2-like isoform X2 [Carex littledalei]